MEQCIAVFDIIHIHYLINKKEYKFTMRYTA